MNRLLPLLIGPLSGSVAVFAADLPVREVILYKNGVGFFVRSGDVPRGESARLDFRAPEMNDVLKSLIVREANGQVVTGVRYDSAEPLEKKLSEFPFRLTPNQTTAAFLDQMKGARIDTGSVKGWIAGARSVKGQEGEDREQVTILTDDGRLLALDLAAITALRFDDPAVQQQLKDYLGALTASRSRDKKSIYLDAPADKPRSLTVTYLAPAPAWKSSYRLLLTEKEPLLEGWAIVDNVSGEDWTAIRLALVSGRPVSFQTRLYEPRYVARDFADIRDAVADRPVLHAGGVIGGVVGGVAGGAPGMAGAFPNAPPPQAARMKRMEASEAVDVTASNIASADARETGELFEYRFPAAVNVRRNESAMLPFLQQKIDARKLLIWTSGDHARNAVEIVNATGKTLDGGPVTVFDGGSYAGEALVDTVKQGDKRLISYAVDQGTRVTTAVDSGEETVREIKASRGVLTVRVARRTVTTYNIRNVDARAKTLLIEHPLRGEAKIIGTQPVETTATARRFEVALKPSSEDKLTVTEETVIAQQEQISQLAPDELLIYAAKRPGDAARKAIEAIAAKKRELGSVRAEMEAAEKQIQALDQDGERTRRNIQSLMGVPGQQDSLQRYSQQLTLIDTQINAARQRVSELRQRESATEGELNTLIERLTI